MFFPGNLQQKNVFFKPIALKGRTACETQWALYDAMALSSPSPAYVHACRRTPAYPYSHVELANTFVILAKLIRKLALKNNSPTALL